MVRQATGLLRHRGPDDEGLWFSSDRTVGLGHRRLSVIDLSASARQPMRRGDLQIVFNGEIYNFRELRRELGGRFETQSDTEVILAAYQRWGERVFEHLRGMFAIAIWDGKRFVLARDRLGIKPLFYARGPWGFAFASEIKALLALGVGRTIDRTAVYDYLTYLYIPAPKTVYSSIRKLLPGHRLIVEDGSERIEPYWDVEFAPKKIAEKEAAAELGERLKDAVESHLVSDVPLGVLLSGGVDSSAVAALAAEAHPGVRTFSVGFDVDEHSETGYARKMAARAGTAHEEHLLEIDEARGLLDRMVEWYDEPYYDTSAAPSYLVCREARKRVTVALTGDGGDEVFGGYSHYRKFAASRKWDVVPAAVRRGVGGSMAKLLRPGSGSRRSMERWALDPLARYAFLLGGIVGPEKEVILPEELRRGFEGYDELWNFRRYWREDWEPYARMQYLDLKTYLPDDILTKMDRVSMSVSLEVRVPLLDHRVVEFTATLPPALRRAKRVFKRSMEEKVPPEILARKKKGFSIPQSRWLEEGLIEDGRAPLRGPARMALWLLDRWARTALGAGSWQEVLRP